MLFIIEISWTLLCFRSPSSTFGGPGSSSNNVGGGDDMEMDESSVEIVDSIDVRQIFGLDQDFLLD